MIEWYSILWEYVIFSILPSLELLYNSAAAAVKQKLIQSSNGTARIK